MNTINSTPLQSAGWSPHKLHHIASATRPKSPKCEVRHGNWQKEASPLTLKLRAAHYRWVESQRHEFNVAVCLHFPNSLRAEERGWDELWHQERLRLYLKQLDRKVLKSGHRRRKEKIPRFVVLEHSPSVGWHVHALLASAPTDLSAERLAQLVELTWVRFLRSHGKRRFVERLAWAEPVEGGYLTYMTEALSSSDSQQNHVDLVNTSLE